MNTSFTDEQLLNLINNTILDETEHELRDFTGGSVQITTTHGHKITSYKVHLFFGYNKSKNPVTFTEEITEDECFIWAKAILTKVASMKVNKLGSTIDKLNNRMNKEKRSKKEIGKEVEGKVIGMVGSSQVRNEVVTKESKYEKERDFSLKTPTTINAVSEEYYDNLEIFLKSYIEDIAMKRIHTGSKLPEPMSFDEFVSALRSSGKKYGNFVATYRTWLQRDASARLSK